MLDASFNLVGTKVIAASADGFVRIYDIEESSCDVYIDHEEEVIKATFDPSGETFAIVTESGRCCIYDSSTGEKLQEISDLVVSRKGLFTCEFNYEADVLVTVAAHGECNAFRREPLK